MRQAYSHGQTSCKSHHLCSRLPASLQLTKNNDGYRGSTYMHKDRDGPLAAGPAWDYNEAYGLCCGYPIEGWDKQGVSGPGG